MELVKQLEFLNPTTTREEIHIIGLGAIGSTVASMLARMGFTNIHLYDFDTVEDKNVCNQTFDDSQVGEKKCNAVLANIAAINPDAYNDITIHPKGWKAGRAALSGYVFLCVDSIDLRNAIINDIEFNTNVKAVFDFRMGLTNAQTYAAAWDNDKDKKKLKASMAFTDEEAKESMPISACGTTLSVRPTVVAIVALGIANFVNMFKGITYHTTMIMDTFAGTITTF